ncbi:AraC family transcriptional regulator [Chitinophagaceae bacterium 26-R-25]|nr:AraC family transcriptional regulator [Chitinophagaceae bacterium 26-R-25]
MELFIRNMVCPRCVKAVRSIAESLKLDVADVELGKVVLKKEPNEKTLKAFDATLQAEGFEIINNKKARVIEQIKKHIISLIQNKDMDEMNVTLSEYLSSKLHHDYGYLSNLFSSVENTTIEQYFILQKIEKVKELLVYNELSLSEIAFKLGYSSVAHLSAQFKKITGFTPSQFRQLKDHKRKPIDGVGR